MQLLKNKGKKILNKAVLYVYLSQLSKESEIPFTLAIKDFNNLSYAKKMLKKKFWKNIKLLTKIESG